MGLQLWQRVALLNFISGLVAGTGGALAVAGIRFEIDQAAWLGVGMLVAGFAMFLRDVFNEPAAVCANKESPKT